MDIKVATGELTTPIERRLASRVASEYEPVFSGVWNNDGARPRFGDEVWEISGMDPISRRGSWTINFSEMSAEWSLIAREMLYIRANARKFRHALTWDAKHREHTFSAGTIKNWHATLVSLEQIALELSLGLPATWGVRDVERLRALIVERHGQTRFGMIINMLYRMRSTFSLGGLRFDPTRDIGIAQWSGDTSTSRVLATRGMDPETFRTIVANALVYVEQCAPDIFTAIEWQRTWTPSLRRGLVPTTHPVRLAHPDAKSDRRVRWQEVIHGIGGIPTSTVGRRTRSAANLGEPCLATLCYAAGVRHNNPNDRDWVERRIQAGARTVPGGLPIAISQVTRADGTTGPWRAPFCAQSVGMEAQTLQDACKIVVMAFTAMRDSELSGIPRVGWRTTWHGADAITAPLIKNGRGEALKWWATPAVIRACEVLEALADPRSEFLFRTVPPLTHQAVVLRGDAYSGRDGATRTNRDRTEAAGNWHAVQAFVERMNTDTHLQGFLPIPAGWASREKAGWRTNNALPLLHPRAFRFTLASISNFVALGDVAFQQQAKHAVVAISHSYAANGATSSWSGTLLNTLANRETADRVAKAADLYQREWAGEQHLAGHAGRDLTRTIRDLLNGLPIAEYDPDSDESQVEQFTTQVMQVPELAAAIKSTAVMLHPGTINHCLRYAPQMECTDKAEPTQGLCRPQTCRNVLLEPEQQGVFRFRLRQVDDWLSMPRVPAVQKAVLERTRQDLEAQLRTEDDT